MIYLKILFVLFFFLLITPFDLAMSQSDKRDEITSNNFAIAIITISISTASVSVPIIVWWLQSRKQKRDKVWDLYKKFYSKEFLPIRNNVWDDVYKNWGTILFGTESIERQIIDTYHQRELSHHFKENRAEYKKFIGYVNNVSIILDFWAEVYLNLREKTMDKKLTLEVFSHMYKWYREFLRDFFVLYYKDREKGKNPNVMWIESISKLDDEFGIDNKNFYRSIMNEILQTKNGSNYFSIILGIMMFLIIPIIGYLLFPLLLRI